MKSTRKLASLLLALVMVFALAVTAFATETGGTTTTPTTGTITVANPVANRTYTAYKIFDVVYDTKDHYSYTIDSSSNEWFETVRTYANDTMHGLTLTQVNGGDTYVVTIGNGFSAPDFAVALKAAVSGKVGRSLSGDANSVSVSNLKLGYYFVSSDTGALCNLTTTKPNITIHDKNDMPFEKKVNNADVANVDVGQDVTFTITGKVPDHTGFDTYIYEIADTMSRGLTFNSGSLKVMVGTADVTDDTDKCKITYDPTTAPNTFKVSIIGVKNCTVGDPIEVTYTATVNKDAIAMVSENKAELTYSNDPTDSESKAKMPPEIVKVYTSKIDIKKYETGKENIKLPGAIFVLYKKAPTDADPNAIQYYKQDDTTKAVTWVDDIAEATRVETDKDGAATFGGLADGTYYLVETKAPAGYNQLTGPVEVPVNGATQLTATAKVENQAGTELPSTGGMGTTIFYVLGFVLVVGAGVLLVTKKRMSQGEV